MKRSGRFRSSCRDLVVAPAAATTLWRPLRPTFTFRTGRPGWLIGLDEWRRQRSRGAGFTETNGAAAILPAQKTASPAVSRWPAAGLTLEDTCEL
jgi:hypothetical protein